MNYTFADNINGLKPSAIREIFKSLTNPNVISFAAGNPSPLSFPTDKLQVLANEIFDTMTFTYVRSDGKPIPPPPF